MSGPDGDSRLIGLIGSGIGRSLSPALHEQEARAQGLRCLCRVIDLDELGLRAADAPALLTAAGRLGFDGLNITHPAKQVVLDHIDELSPEAAALGAVNTVVFRDHRSTGHNTDGSGFARAFTRGLPGARLERVALLGAGGAGAAVAHAALGLGTGLLTVVDLDDARAAALAARLAARFGAHRVQSAAPDRLADLLAEADGLIHATPTGMAGRPGLPLPAPLLHPRLWVADIVYVPLETDLLRAARAAGCRTLDGGGMAVFQAVDAFRLFTGHEADAARMLRHFRALAGPARPIPSGACDG